MALSIRETVLRAFLARLETITAIGTDPREVTVDRNRDQNVSAFPTLVQVDGGQQTRDRLTGADVKAMEVTVEIHLDADDPEALTDLLDAAYVAVSDAIDNGPTLGGVAIDAAELSFTPDFLREGKRPSVRGDLVFEVLFEHRSDAVTSAA